MQASARAIAESASAMFKEAQVVCDVKVVEGSPGRVISEMAKDGEFDLVVMGSRGHSDMAGLLLGSVSHKVLQAIHCPVLIVP